MMYFNAFAAACMTTAAVKNCVVGDYRLAGLEALVAVNAALWCVVLRDLKKSSRIVERCDKGERYDEWA